MIVLRGVVRNRYSLARLTAGPHQSRDAFPDGAELRVHGDDGSELVVQLSANAVVKPLASKSGRWQHLENDPLAETFRVGGPAPHHEVTLESVTLAPGDRVEIEGEPGHKATGFAALGVDRNQRSFAATRLTKLDANAESHPPAPEQLSAPLLALIPLAVFAVARFYLAEKNGAAWSELAADLLSTFLVALAFYWRRTRGLRILAIKPERPSSSGSSSPSWGFLNGTYSPDVQAFLVILPAMTIGFTLMLEDVRSAPFGPYETWPAVCFFAISMVLFATELRTWLAARIMLKAPALTASSPDGQWGSIIGNLHVKEPLSPFGVPCLAVYANRQKFVSTGMGKTYSGANEYDSGDVSFAKFIVETEDRTSWHVDPANAVWASSGRVTPKEQVDVGNGYSLTFAEVLPAQGRVLVAGRVQGRAFKTADRDGLYIAGAPDGGDPRARLRAYLRWSLVVCALPLLAIAVMFACR